MGEPTENRVSYLVTFDCGHSKPFVEPAPAIGESLYCVRCNLPVRVVAAPPEWQIRCQNCMYSRKFGLGRTAAELAASKHRMKNPDHNVGIYNGKERIDTVGNCNQTVIPMMPNSDRKTG